MMITHIDPMHSKVLVHPTLRRLSDAGPEQVYWFEIANYWTAVDVFGRAAAEKAFRAFQDHLRSALGHAGVLSDCGNGWVEVTVWKSAANKALNSNLGSKSWCDGFAKDFALEAVETGQGPLHLDIWVSQPQRTGDQTSVGAAGLGHSAASGMLTEDAKRLFRSDMALLSPVFASIGGSRSRASGAPCAHICDVAIGWRPIARSGLLGCPAFFEAALMLVREDGQFEETDPVIAAAGRLGLAHLLDHYLVTSAVDELVGSVGSVALLVSVASESLADGPFWDEIISRLSSTGVAASDLVIEIRGAATSGFGRGASETLSKLKASGCRIAFGRFGLGATSLRDIAAFAPDLVSIDRHFVSAQFRDQFGTGPLFHLACLARSLGADVVVDGVDCAETAALVQEVGASLQKGDWCGGLRLSRSWAARPGIDALCDAPRRAQMGL